MQRNRSRKALSVVLLAALLLASYLCLFRTATVQASENRIFSCSTVDGDVNSNSNDYTVVHDASSGSVHATSSVFWVGQFIETFYSVYRGYLFFDLSAVPESATIESAILSVYVNTDASITNFNLTIQNGQPTYPHNPLQSGDYYYARYSGDGGSRSTSTIGGAGYWNITLSATGLTWLSSGAVKLCLRASTDINDVAPSDYELLILASAEAGSSYAAKLYVTYSSAGATYLIHGPYLEDGTVYNGIVNVTLHKPYSEISTYVLNGTSGAEDNETISLDQPALFFSWNITAYNFTRTYYLLGDSFEEIWINIPSTEEAATYYAFTITDFYGMTNPFLQTTINVDGVERVVESRDISTTSVVTFLFTQWHTYGLKFICDEGTYTQQFLAESVFANNIQVLSGAFPIADIALGLDAWCNRTSGTNIEVYYADNNEATISLYMEITHRSGTTDILDYSSTTTGSSQSLTWTDAAAKLDYDVYLEALRSDNTYIWHLQAASLTANTNPFAGLLETLGTWPTGFNPAQIPAATIIVAVLAIFSVYSATVGIVLALIIAGVLSVLGFFVVGVTNLAFAAFVAILAHLGESKKTEREV